MFAAGMLAELRDRESVPLLLDVIKYADTRVQTRAITALRILGDRRAAPHLRELMQQIEEPSVVKASLAALGRLGSPPDVPLVLPFLLHSDEGVRVLAAGALAMLGSRAGEAILLGSSRSSDPLAQKSATFALGFLNTSEARIRLSEILNDPSGRWKAYASMALAEQRLATQSPQQQVEYLGEMAQSQERIVTKWALDRLVDLDTAEATEMLQNLASEEGRSARMADRVLRVIQRR